MVALLEEIWSRRYFIAEALVLVLLFVLLQFWFQWVVASNRIFNIALARALAFSGATLIAAALLVGPLAILRPSINFIRFRRALGVAGFALGVIHGLWTFVNYFGSSLAKTFPSTDPFSRALVFGSLAALVMFPAFLTSTDWAMRKLGGLNWKRVQYLTYAGFVLLALHFSRINVGAMNSVPGYLLYAVSAVAVVLQVAAFSKRTYRVGMGLSTVAAVGLAALTIVLFYASLALRPA